MLLKYILALLLLLPAQVWGGVFVGFGQVTGGDGPNTWYYGEGSDNYPNQYSYTNTNEWGDSITIGQAGTLTKIAFKVGTAAVGTAVKLAFFDSASPYNRLGTCTVSSVTDDSWNECTLSSGVSVTTNQVITVAGIGSEQVAVKYGSTTGGHYRSGQTYSSWPPSTDQRNNDYKHAVRVYVD